MSDVSDRPNKAVEVPTSAEGGLSDASDRPNKVAKVPTSAGGSGGVWLDDVEDCFPRWRKIIIQIQQARQPSAPQVNELRWQLGREICDAIQAHSQTPKTALMEAIAGRLGCSRGLIYQLANVATAFPDELPAQQWSALVRLSAFPPQQRSKLLADLPEWAPARLVPAASSARDEKLPPESQAGKREAAEAAERLKAAEAAYRALPVALQMQFLLDRLQEMDIGAAAGHPLSLRALARDILNAAETVVARIDGSATDADPDPIEASDEGNA